MKRVCILFLAIAGMVPAAAQPDQAARIAVIDSSSFANELTGIRRVVNAHDLALGGFVPYPPEGPTPEWQARKKAAYDRRLKILLAPVEADIEKALNEFREARGLGQLLDVAKYPELVLVASPEIDITTDFIAYFNKLGPPYK